MQHVQHLHVNKLALDIRDVDIVVLAENMVIDRLIEQNVHIYIT